MSKLAGRVRRLERRRRTGKKLVFISRFDENFQNLPEQEFERRLAAARAEAGPDGVVLIMQFETDPEAAEQAEGVGT